MSILNPVLMPSVRLFVLFALIALVSVFTALLFGTFPISVVQVFDSVVFQIPGVVQDVIWKLRLPRALAAFACGGLLATAGVLLQVLLRNPLADPYILGVSGGAALGALTALLLAAGAFVTSLAAFVGATSAIGIVFLLSFRSAEWNIHRLLLTGVVLSAGFTALISLVLVLAPQAQLKGMLYWLMGDLSLAGASGPAWLILGVVLIAFTARGASLNVLGLGPAKALALGLAVVPLQAAVYFAAAVATVGAVMLGGSIGFVGLLVPHALRLLGVNDHRALLPAAALVGGSFVVLADTLARTAWSPQQLPVGVFTALIGVPALLFLLSRKR